MDARCVQSPHSLVVCWEAWSLLKPCVLCNTQEFGGGYPSSPDFDDEGGDAAYGGPG